MHKIQEEMLRIFELKAWRAGGQLTPVVNDKDEVIKLTGFFVEYIWFAQIFCYKKPFYIGFMKASENYIISQKAAIAVDEKILGSIDVSEYKDSVISSLNCINLANTVGATGEIPGYLLLDISVAAVEAHIFAGFYSGDTSLRKLQENVLKTLEDLILLYEDTSLQKLLVLRE